MKNIYQILFLLTILVMYSSCNDEWEDEQFEHYVSFKAPLDDNGVTPVYVRYKADGAVTYKLPLIVSGSKNNMENLQVHIGVDSDTLTTHNYARFQSREELYYRELGSSYYEMAPTIDIASGENTALLDINYSLKDIDLVDKWVLPLTILNDDSYNYVANPNKNYKKALLRVMPFNDYSGSYSSTALSIYLKGYEDDAAIVRSTTMLYVVDESTAFFYAGTVDEDNTDRRSYKINAKFNEDNTVTLTAEDPNIKFVSNSTPVFSIEEEVNYEHPYILDRYVTISNIDYDFTDYTSVEGYEINYTVQGTIMLHRSINTQIPDEDQAIQW
ncbi:DUF4973 domain-containing protein [Plebeiibacterium marinum]|uniref:DUF4973 domain-containing protein n=1 Tax=Plebeiibacterium marinum TaxID=2992111 RepID=A0AAE3SJK7_9BACT|nr:DUF4973 domain-containing protein [Plebeiobacterium marinum]MCW3804460.1 DUF4973 domain-containing protein [Plebeiobacterium marinum]